jgi:predicted branched-subunit amino acid permease
MSSTGAARGRAPRGPEDPTGSPVLRPPRLTRAALRDTIPVALSIAPLGLVIGATARTVPVPPLPNMAVAAGVFAGAAHLAALTTMAAGAGVLTVLGTVALINARLLLYSAALEPRFRHQPPWFRWLGPALLIDQTYLMVTARDDLDHVQDFRRYWSVAGGALLASWVCAVGLGSVVGPLLPHGSPLDAAAVVVLAGMLAPRLTTLRPAVVAGASLLVAVVAAPLSGGVGVVTGIGAGLVVGVALDRSRR